jgi:exopolysaccharide biosynthesis polyprenyl glycosylphosphotransferase
MKSNASLLYSLILVIGDFFALVAAFGGAYILRVTINITNEPIHTPVHASTYLGIFLSLLPFWILLFALLGLYNSSIYEKRFSEIGRLFIGSFIGMLFVISYAYAVNQPVFPGRLVPVFGFGLAFIFLLLIRSSARAIRTMLFKYDIGITNLLIVGNTRVAKELAESLADARISGYKILGVVGDKVKLSNSFPDLRIFKDFEEAVSKLHARDIHSIVQTELFASGKQNNEILEFAQTNHIAYRFIPGNSELFVGNIDVELFRSSIPVIAVHQTALIGWGRIIKRLTDLVLGSIFLLISAPFMFVIAILMKVFEPTSPIFYKDPRLSRFGTTIKVYKFRSLKKAYNDMSPEEAFAKMGKQELITKYRNNGDQLAKDPRISMMGRILRRTSLDELPQFINVVKGDISLVGPRALQHSELEQYAKKDMILAIKSGLTGLAQVSGRRDINFEERRKLDLFYVQNWSFWLDLTIIAKTIRVVLGRIGAK